MRKKRGSGGQPGPALLVLSAVEVSLPDGNRLFYFILFALCFVLRREIHLAGNQTNDSASEWAA
ncbi:MAG: hypothetical protein A2147_04670 [Chloroflexi bacterium RBG_16_57_8]|nr:MAG: hypothetical protein A2147_04670 [Chloroflexi bacterium RBG_16_57_8]